MYSEHTNCLIKTKGEARCKRKKTKTHEDQEELDSTTPTCKYKYYNWKKTILTQRKLGKYNHESGNDNNPYSNKKSEINEKNREFTTRIYREYYNANNKANENKEEDYNYNKENQKKNYGYNPYQSSSSAYGAFFHMNK